LGHGDKGLLSDPVIKKIADAHGKSIAQIILRWHIQEGFSVIPGATNPVHINENINIFDFKLSDAEMATMRSLNKDKRFFNVTLQQLDSWATGNF
jgi:diketogulonate reductase-like aldo/keto reductase